MINQNNISLKATSTVARSADGTIQITFTIAWEVIKKARREAITELAKDIEVPGFRKGKAPENKVQEQIPQNTLLEKTLSIILPKTFTDTIVKEKIKPAIYPKFEVLKAEEENDWQVRAVTAEIPEIEPGDYRKIISQAGNSKKIWTPQQTRGKLLDKEKPIEPNREEKEQEVIKALLSEIKVSVPKVLIDEEANSRLSQLLARLEKLGLTLELYLASIKKTAVSLRQEYEEQAKRGIALDIILNKIADAENIKIADSQIDAAIAAASSDPKLAENLKTPGQRRVIASILRRRRALDSLILLL